MKEKTLSLNFGSQDHMTEQAAEKLAKEQLQELRFSIGTARKTIAINDPVLLRILKQAVLIGARKAGV